MTQSQKDTIKKFLALIIKFLVLVSIVIIILYIFLDINIYLFIGAIVFFVIFLIFSLILVIFEAYTDDDKEANKIIHKWIESEKTEQASSNFFCPICGQSLYLDTKYCSNCGSVLKNK